MINSRLYYDLKELIQGILNFYYFTVEMDENAVDLKSYTKTINQQEVLSTLDNIGVKNLLFNINEAEFSRFLLEVKKHKDFIYNLSLTDPTTANIEIAKLWGPNKLEEKFSEWFIRNGYTIPKQ